MTKIFLSLVKIRLASLFTPQKNKAKATPAKSKLGKVPKIILFTFLIAYCVVVFFGMFGLLFYSIGASMGGTELEWFYFSLATMISFALCFIGSVFATQTQLYDAKDNELLLSMPVPVKFILASRMVALLLMNVLYEAIVMLPAIVVWGILGNYTIGSAIGMLILFILIPFLSLSLSCVVGWLIALATSKIKRKNLVTTALSIVALVAYFAVCTGLSDYMDMLINNGAAIAEAIKKSFYPAYALGLAGDGNFLMMLLSLAAVAILFSAIYFILDKTFIKISIAKRGNVRIKYKEKKLKVSSQLNALTRKEFQHFITSPAYIMNGAMGVIFSGILSVAVLFAGTDFVSEFTSVGVPVEFVEFFAIMISLSITGFNMISAPSISIEGKNLWLIQSLPIDPSKILLSKALNHFYVSEVGTVLIAASAAIALPISAIVKILLFIVPSVMNVFCALFGVFVNLQMPKFDWINETVAIKQGMSSLICMFLSMGVAVLYLLPYLFWLVSFMAVEVYTLIFTIILVLLSFLLYSYLVGKGREKFMKLGQ